MLAKIFNSAAGVALLLVLAVIVCATILVGLGHQVPSWFIDIGLTSLAASLGHATVKSLSGQSGSAGTATSSGAGTGGSSNTTSSGSEPASSSSPASSLSSLG